MLLQCSVILPFSRRQNPIPVQRTSFQVDEQLPAVIAEWLVLAMQFKRIRLGSAHHMNSPPPSAGDRGSLALKLAQPGVERFL